MLVIWNYKADLFAAGGGHALTNASLATGPFSLEAIIAVYKVQWSMPYVSISKQDTHLAYPILIYRLFFFSGLSLNNQIHRKPTFVSTKAIYLCKPLSWKDTYLIKLYRNSAFYSSVSFQLLSQWPVAEIGDFGVERATTGEDSTTESAMSRR
jgi:hypothetical protein